MPMLASTHGAQSSIERKMEAFSIPGVLLKGISETLLHMESKMFGFVRYWIDLSKLSGFAPKVGSAATNGSFEDFREQLITSRVEVTFYFLENLAEFSHGFKTDRERPSGGDQLWQQSGRMPGGQPVSGRYFLFPQLHGGENCKEIVLLLNSQSINSTRLCARSTAMISSNSARRAQQWTIPKIWLFWNLLSTIDAFFFCLNIFLKGLVFGKICPTERCERWVCLA